MDLALDPVTDPPLDELVEHLVVRRHLGEQDDPGRARVVARAQVERLAARTRVLDVVVDGQPAGRVWIVTEGDEQAVLRLALDDPALACGVRALVEHESRELGARRLTVGVHPGDPVTQAFVDAPGFELAATQMRLDLRQDLPPEDVVVLEVMDAVRWESWMAASSEAYAQERVLSGESADRARAIAEEQMGELLPDGQATDHHHFFVGRVGGQVDGRVGGEESDVVGTIWLGTERPLAFVYDVEVEAHLRGRGYGAGLMRAGASWAQQRGAHALGLNVFGHNHGARALYGKLGYEVVELFLGEAL